MICRTYPSSLNGDDLRYIKNWGLRKLEKNKWTNFVLFHLSSKTVLKISKKAAGKSGNASISNFVSKFEYLFMNSWGNGSFLRIVSVPNLIKKDSITFSM